MGGVVLSPHVTYNTTFTPLFSDTAVGMMLINQPCVLYEKTTTILRNLAQ
jgi:hypothetical protein